MNSVESNLRILIYILWTYYCFIRSNYAIILLKLVWMRGGKVMFLEKG